MIDSEYVRKGTCSIFIFTEPLSGIRHVTVRKRRTSIDWAEEIKYLTDVCYPDIKRITSAMDNLNTLKISSLYKAFPATEARRITKHLAVHYTPKHGNWLNIAEIELNVMTRQCLNRRIDDIVKLRSELSSWETERNNRVSTINWQFTNNQTRTKLVSLYPKID